MYQDKRITATPSNGEVVSILEGDIHTVTSSYTRGITDQYFTKQDCFCTKRSGVYLGLYGRRGYILQLENRNKRGFVRCQVL